MNVLVTGAFGNIGSSTLAALAGRGHHVRALDRDTPQNRRRAARLPAGFEVAWGDVRDRRDVERAVRDRDVVIHLAAIIPPATDRDLALARSVNVDGTRTVLNAARRVNPAPRLVFASSVSVHGPSGPDRAPIAATDPIRPSDAYSHHKAECEALIRASGVPWTILRLNAVMPLTLAQFDPLFFEVNLDSPVEFAHTRDVGVAFANAVDAPDAAGRVLLVAGGRASRMRYREFFRKFLDAAGISMLPEEAFGTKPFYTAWMDTAEAERLLRFQHLTYDDYLEEIRALLGWRRALVLAARPAVRRWLLTKSPRVHPARSPSPAAWALVGTGMSLTALLAASDAAYRAWTRTGTAFLPRAAVRRVLAAAVALHALEALVAWRVARRRGPMHDPAGWAWQTLLLGYPSLRLLLERAARPPRRDTRRSTPLRDAA